MQRLPYPNMSNISGPVKERLEARLPLNIYKMLCHAPTLFPAWMDLGRGVLYESMLDAKLRELAILRIGYLANSAYETHQHRKIAMAVGLSPEKIEGLRHEPNSAIYAPIEMVVLRMTEQVVSNVKADDSLFSECVNLLGQQQTMELLISIGFYMMVVRVIENTGIEIEIDGGPSQDEVAQARIMTLAALSNAGEKK
jgi:4-carboxymuconolactone decarboxylase